ncbi:MAG: S8 family serine peptidase [Pseudomonadota bacterium]
MPIRTLSACTALFVIAACQSVSLDIPADSEIRAAEDEVVDPNEIVVLMPSQANAQRLIQKAIPIGYRVKAENELAGLDLVMLTLSIPAGQDGGSAIRELEGLEPGVTAGVNHAYATQAQPLSGSPRSYASNLLEWNPGECDALRKIGVLDTGISSKRNTNLKSRDFSREAGGSETTSHGDAIIDILLSKGLLGNLEVFHADIVSQDETLGAVASVDTMMLGLNWLISEDVDLVNISLAGPYNKILDRGFQNAARRGVVVVAAAGNAGPETPVLYPAAFRSTLAVTAVDSREEIYKKGTRGNALDFSAPGVDVFVGDEETGRYVSGTSIAAPFVTLRIAGDGTLTGSNSVGAVRRQIAQSVKDLGEEGFDQIYGHGLIRAPATCRSYQ